MTFVTPLCSKIITRFFYAGNSPKALHNLRRRRGFLKNDYHRVVAIQPLLRPFSVISNPRQRSRGGTTLAVGFSTMSKDGGNGRQEVEFQLSPLLKIQIGDITRWSVDGSSDAIVTISFLLSNFLDHIAKLGYIR